MFTICRRKGFSPASVITPRKVCSWSRTEQAATTTRSGRFESRLARIAARPSSLHAKPMTSTNATSDIAPRPAWSRAGSILSEMLVPQVQR
jgi:hypothetical protein